MSYVKTTWVDGTTPLSAENLNKIENGLSEFGGVDNRTGHKQVFTVEKSGTTHAGGFGYTSFSGGATIRGKEIYVSRCALTHTTTVNNWGRIVAYTRNEDGSITSKIIALDYSAQEYRDPSITLHSSGNYLILTATGYDGTTYKGYFWLLDENLNIVSGPKLMGSNIYLFGNALTTPSGKIIKAAYSTTLTTPILYLYVSSGAVITGGSVDVGTFAQHPLMSVSGVGVNECTIAYWGNKLIAITRCYSNGAYYSETTDLEGLTGWTTPRLFYPNDTGVSIHAPCLEPYTEPGKPFVLSYSSSKTGRVRLPTIIFTFDGVIWSNEVFIDTKGAYTTLVKTQLGYGCMYYEEIDTNHTNLYLKDIDLNKILTKIPGKFPNWIAITTFQNNYKIYGGAYGNAVRYYKDSDGNVHLNGVIGSYVDEPITSARTIFTLPLGYRPIISVLLSTISASAFGALIILPTGEVTHAIGNTNNVSLQNIIFSTL